MTSTILPLSDPFGAVASREAGQERSATPLVLIHGVGMQSAAWAPQIDALSRTRRVIALDMPGHGGSDPIAAGSDLPAFVDWLRAALDAHELDRVCLAGHSMGAMIAGGFAVQHPERIERVALLNGVFERTITARRSVIDRANQIEAGVFDLETPLQRWFGSSSSDQATRAVVAKWLSSVDIDGYATAYAAFARGDRTYSADYGKIACPFLALTGDGDTNSTPAMARAMAKAVPGGKAVIIQGHRHMVNLTASASVNAALENWLRVPAKEGAFHD